MKNLLQIIVSVILFTDIFAVSIKKGHSNFIFNPTTFLAASQDAKPIVIDSGYGYIKIGFGGDNKPKSVFPSLVGTDGSIGEAAVAQADKLKIQHPIDRADGTPSWEGVQALWKHAYEKELKVEPSSAPVLLTGRLLNNKEYREKIMEILFKTFKVPALNFIHPAVAALAAVKRTTGIVVNVGEGDLSVVPVVDSLPLSNAIITAPLGGGEITDYLVKLLKDAQYNFQTYEEREIVRNIKETLCFVAPDFNELMSRAETTSEFEKNYELPDGQVITVGRERFSAPEVLFKPSLIGLESEGIHNLIYGSIMKTDPKVRKDLYNNIVLTGGSTLFNSIDERLLKEISAIASPTVRISVIASPQRGSLSWIGASKASSSFESSWISVDDYSEKGPSILKTKDYYKTS